ncbi:hypothetical protein K438DRAFT_1990449 [Mycena galopus ATCC 62051]|nr:hypothetical protein K438DRAFT_1990449 [Mycena galopus ATCC 62051]
MTYAIPISSPNKADRILSIEGKSTPTISAVRIAAITSLDDTFWDVAQWTEEASTVQRPRTLERPAVRKTVLREMLAETEALSRQILQIRADVQSLQEGREQDREELSALKAKFIEESEEKLRERDVVELHESLDRCLQGFSDVIFDTRSQLPGRLTDQEKARMKQYKSDYLTYILSPAPATTPPDVVALRAKALKLLTPPQLKLCRFLYEQWKAGQVQRNTQQHEQPDRETALERLEEAGVDSEGLAVLRDFLHTNPARLPGSGENASDIHLRLFAPSGTYKKVAVLRGELEKLWAGRAVGKSQQA